MRRIRNKVRRICNMDNVTISRLKDVLKLLDIDLDDDTLDKIIDAVELIEAYGEYLTLDSVDALKRQYDTEHCNDTNERYYV